LLSFNYRYQTKDETKNYALEEGCKELINLLQHNFQNAALFTTSADFLLQTSKKGAVTLLKQKPSFTSTSDVSHDRQKVKRASGSDHYLTLLGVNDEEGKLIPKMADKFRQINKYLEIMEDLVRSVVLPEKIHVVDMGSGKGYLTFALYDFLKNKLSLDVTVTGIELRTELVEYCNSTAQQCGFDQLQFVCQPIEDYKDKHIDILIALHACDTATDDALYKGILSKASLVVCAPCCHKQIRQQVKGIEQESPLLKYGIFKERQFEMVTDTIRALIMEQHQYQTKIFEFISNEHTRKNVMLVASRAAQPADLSAISTKIKAIKDAYHIDFHYLEKLTKKV
jgi:SAM-dependent methyltransferase